jgi:hypothetical protein
MDMNDEDIDKAAKAILYKILVHLIDEYEAIEKCATSKKWRQTLDELEELTAEVLRDIIRSM